MAKNIPKYGKTVINGKTYYRTRINLPDGSRKTLYDSTCQALFAKVQEFKLQLAVKAICLESPTVSEYCSKWLRLRKAQVGNSTFVDYAAKVRIYIVTPLGDKLMRDVTVDDIKEALIPASTKSKSTYAKVHMLFSAIFASAEENNIIECSPCRYISAKGGAPQKTRAALSDQQVSALLNTIKGLPPELFVHIALYTGLRREEILGLMWDCVFLNTDTPYLSIRRAWRSEHNRPIISEILKSDAACRDVPIPDELLKILYDAKKTSSSEYVICNSDGLPLSYSQFQRIWAYITTRTATPRTYRRYIDGKAQVHTINPELGEKAKHNPNVIYSLDFKCTPHQLRHTYATNLIAAGVDPKIVQYLLGHKNSRMTMDIYAKVKYNRPEDLHSIINNALTELK